MNLCCLMGNVTRDVEVRYTKSGTAVVNFSLAYNRRVKDASGEYKDQASFIECQAWGKTAEFISKYWSKGKKMLINGRLEQQRWEKDGKNNSKVIIIVEQAHFTDSAKKETKEETFEEGVDLGL